MKIYIINPWHVSGGQENVHQLCSEFNDMGVDCYLLYTFCHMGTYVPKKSDENVFVPEYENMNLKRSFVVEDEEENVLIIPEAFHPDVIHQIKKMKVAYWWLSIDNPKYQWEKTNRMFQRVFNICHSDKAFKILSSHVDSSKVILLHDHINDLFIRSEKELIHSLARRKRQVLYNPLKQPEHITTNLKDIVGRMDPTITFKPVEGLSLKQVSELGMESRLYMDFGYHPGREHLPREMVISGCSVITGDEGTASDDDDVPLKKRKFKRPYDFESISKAIVNEVNNHTTSFFDEELKEYREVVRKDKERFHREAVNFLEIIKKSPLNLMDVEKE